MRCRPGAADRWTEKLFLPLAFEPQQINHDFHWLLIMGRLKRGVTLAQANADMVAVTKQIAKEFPASNSGWNGSRGMKSIAPFLICTSTFGTPTLLSGPIDAYVASAIFCSMRPRSRGTTRQREVAVRSSMGASGPRLFAQFLTESVVLATIGGVVGLVLAYFLLDVIMALIPDGTLPSEADVRLNIRMLLFTLGVSVVSGVLFGSAPAFQVTRWNLNDVLKEAGRSAIGGGRQWTRRAFVVAEFALALTLLAGAGLAIRSVLSLTYVDLGFRTDHLLTFSLPVPSDRFKDPEQVTVFYRQLLDKIHAIPGVTHVAAGTGMPVAGTGFGMPFTIVGKPVSDPGQRPGAGGTSLPCRRSS